jgi:DNA-binding NtrC family response regulator
MRDGAALGGELLRWARSDVTITLHGETGTGKDRLARTLHAHSRRSDGPFVVLDCGAVVSNLAESELFGHERGSFTGAVKGHPGAFERAHGGTLFMDEIGELPIDLQPRLLRALENREVRRVGGTEVLKVDVRVISATNRDLRREVHAGRFREDLYYRLSTALIEVPPLRSRLDHLPELVTSLLRDLGQERVLVAPEVYDVLRMRPWFGNVRELKNVLSLALAFVDQGILTADKLKFASSSDDALALDRVPVGGYPLQDLEVAAIEQTLRQTDGNRVRAAERLGIAVSTLYEKMKRYGLG